tara:strand:+ start:408 stop:674 length:267 start_codon:yes stop_codon:yes gene_type:complete
MCSPQWIEGVAFVLLIKNSLGNTCQSEVPIDFETTNALRPPSAHVAVSITDHGIEWVTWWNFFIPPIDFGTTIDFHHELGLLWGFTSK